MREQRVGMLVHCREPRGDQHCNCLERADLGFLENAPRISLSYKRYLVPWIIMKKMGLFQYTACNQHCSPDPDPSDHDRSMFAVHCLWNQLAWIPRKRII